MGGVGDRQEPALNFELTALRAVTTRLPRVRGAGIFGNLAREFFARKPRTPVVADVRGAVMELDPGENVDGSLLFCPQLYDCRELAALLEELVPGDVFVDVGSHIGLYALQAARRVAPAGRVVAIEADPSTEARLAGNVRRNPGLSIATVCVAVSDASGTARLRLNTSGNRGGNSLLSGGDDAIEVPCRTLAAILAECGVGRVDGMKLDVEGMEYRVLRRYLADVAEPQRPRIIVLEHQDSFLASAGGDAVALLADAGYRQRLATRVNRVMVRA
jgi:FkbM family methyltransferase